MISAATLTVAAVVYVLTSRGEGERLFAACLTGVERVELCTLDSESGEVNALGVELWPGSSLDVLDSAVIFSDSEGEIIVRQGDGRLLPTGARGLSPRFLTSTTALLLAMDGTSLVSLDLRTGAESTYLDLRSAADTTIRTASIRSFDASGETGGEILVVLALEHSEGLPDPMYSMALLRSNELAMLGTPSATWIDWPDIHPEGDSVAVTRDGVIAILDLDGAVQELVTSPTWQATTPRWSPKGDALVWYANGVPSGDDYIGPALLMITDLEKKIATVVSDSGGLDLTQFPAFPVW